MTNDRSISFVLSIYPTSRGFSFVLFENAASPFDWGTKEIRARHKNAETLALITHLIERYRPDALIIEDYTERGSRRSPRIRRLCRAPTDIAPTYAIGVHRFSRTTIRLTFAPIGAHSKYEIAQAVAARIPALAHRLPRLRKIWMSEDARQHLFYAAALGLAYFSEIYSGPQKEEVTQQDPPNGTSLSVREPTSIYSTPNPHRVGYSTSGARG
jgi:hypothetical protein